MGRFNSMMVVFLVALVLGTSPTKAIECMTAISNVFPCSDFLKNPNSAQPGSNCCNAARNWIDFGDADSFCKCIQPIVSQFLALKAQQLPGLCNLDNTYLPLVNCLAPPFIHPTENQEKTVESNDDVGLNQLLPPLPLIPLPPLPLIPPAENQQKDLHDGLLPPLPLVPLPPLPPLIPLPPLPLVPQTEEQNKNEASDNSLGADGLLPPLPFVPIPPLPTIPLPPLPFVPLPPLPTIPLPQLPLIPPVVEA